MSLLWLVASVSSEDVLMASSWWVGSWGLEGIAARCEGMFCGFRIVVRARTFFKPWETCCTATNVRKPGRGLVSLEVREWEWWMRGRTKRTYAEPEPVVRNVRCCCRHGAWSWFVVWMVEAQKHCAVLEIVVGHASDDVGSRPLVDRNTWARLAP